MDMEEILNTLYELVVDNDEKHRKMLQQTAATAEPQYERLRAALGEEEGDNIWDAALGLGISDKDFIFRAGLGLGMQLMTLCLA